MNGPVRWGLLGAGWIARRAIAPAVHSADGAVLHLAAARDRDRAEYLGPVGATADYQAVIDDPAVEAVFIALANDQHRPWALAALAAGKWVLCEKPLGLNAEEVRELRAAEAGATGRLVEATWNLWHPRTRRAAALVRSGAIGEVTSVDGAFTFDGVADGNYRLDPTRGGGALLDVGCYPLTAAAWATGDDLDVAGADQLMSSTGVDLTTEASLTGRASGAQVRIRASFTEAPRQPLDIRGTVGSVSLREDAFTSYLTASSLVLTQDGEAEPRLEQFAPVDPYRIMIEHVSRAVRSEDAWLPDPALSLRVASAMDQIAGAAAGV